MRVYWDVPRLRAHLPRRLFLVAMLAGSAVITANSLAYFDFDAVAPFVVERLPERFASIWLAALRVHVAAALVTLPPCLVLMTRWLQRRPVWHRRIGRFTGVVVLLALVPSGIVLALHAKGGALVTAGFLLSAAILAVSMVGGVLAVRRREVIAHQRAMRHVVGQMSVAVTSRALLIAFDAAGIDPDLAYVIGLWGPVVATAAVVEVLSLLPRSTLLPLPHPPSPERPSRREISPLAPMVRLRSLPRPLVRPGR
jgi:Predicted membrane protein (DUF2306)